MALQCGIVGLPNVGEVYAFQLLIECESTICKLPVLYDRTERWCNHRSRRASEQTGGN